MKRLLTGSQTVGPYFAIGMGGLCAARVPGVAGEDAIVIEGRLLDGNGAPIPDGLLEVWRADLQAAEPASSLDEAYGFARVSTGPDGGFRFTTGRPKAVPYDETRMQAPHFVVLVFMRGLLRNLVTRLYFPDEFANLTDPVLQLVPANRRHTLIAQCGARPDTLHWDVVVREQEAAIKEETVFFAW